MFGIQLISLKQNQMKKSMAANIPQQHAAIKCTENIAMLHLLHGCPEMPSTNPTTPIQSRQKGYTIPFAEERRLAGVFAFLAHIKDDSDHIPAVCLQEIPEKHCLNIVLAVNRDRPGDGKAYSANIKEGFERIAAVLRDATGHSRTLEWDIFNLIIDICRGRILCRLRFVKKQRDGASRKRMTIIEGLQLVVGHLNKNPSNNTKLFLERARRVIKLASSWRNHETLQQLVELVQGVNSLRQTDKFKEILLESTPNQVVSPSIKSHLFNMIRKISRYRESASLLLQAARNFAQVRQMHVVVVELPADAFMRPIISQDYSPTIDSTVFRVSNVKKSLKNVQQMCDLLKIPTAKANTQYSAQVRQTLKSSKIHAEVQLLYYCETMLAGKAPLPRVICSSKSACWLCNAFIFVHKKIHTPRSHGRLYPGWRLPNLHGGWCDDIASRLNRHLEIAVAQSLKDLHQRRTRTGHPDPIESDLSTIIWPLSNSSNMQLLDNIVRRDKIEQVDTIVERDAPKSSEKIATMSQDRLISVEEIPTENAVLEQYASSGSVLIRRSISPVVPNAASGATDTCTSEDAPHRPREHTMSYRVPLGEISSLYPSGPVKLLFEYSSSSRPQLSDDNSSKQLLCTAEWLSQNDFKQLGLEAGIVINTESLNRDEVAHSTDSANNIYLGFGEAILKVTMKPVLWAADASGSG
ncbi:hypothetical protein F4825DRAFT_57982 [Nemania diffusa]|nr:hypothetical protein F4825DRAFT_57982 [Nemania diffusa]